METTTFMVTKAKRGIYQRFNFSFSLYRVMKIGMLLVWFPNPLAAGSQIWTNLHAYVELKSGTQHELTRKPTDAQNHRYSAAL